MIPCIEIDGKVTNASIDLAVTKYKKIYTGNAIHEKCTVYNSAGGTSVVELKVRNTNLYVSPFSFNYRHKCMSIATRGGNLNGNYRYTGGSSSISKHFNFMLAQRELLKRYCEKNNVRFRFDIDTSMSAYYLTSEYDIRTGKLLFKEVCVGNVEHDVLLTESIFESISETFGLAYTKEGDTYYVDCVNNYYTEGVPLGNSIYNLFYRFESEGVTLVVFQDTYNIDYKFELEQTESGYRLTTKSNKTICTLASGISTELSHMLCGVNGSEQMTNCVYGNLFVGGSFTHVSPVTPVDSLQRIFEYIHSGVKTISSRVSEYEGKVSFKVIWKGEEMDLNQAMRTNRDVFNIIYKKCKKREKDYILYNLRCSGNDKFTFEFDEQEYTIVLYRGEPKRDGNTLYFRHTTFDTTSGRIDGVHGIPFEDENFVKVMNKAFKALYPIFSFCNILTEDSLSNTKTRKAKIEDFVFKAGVEFETGLRRLQASYGGNANDQEGCFYSYGFDGGGVELRSSVLADPTLFKFIGKYDAFCKKMRSDTNYRPNYSMGTHIHMSISPRSEYTDGAKAWVNSDSMLRRRLLTVNWFSLMNKYTSALTFFDTFNPGSRRRSYYGLPLEVKKDSNGDMYTYFDDSRFTSGRFGNLSRTDAMRNFDRGSLLRTTIQRNDKRTLHWEWRGTDGCPSAIFLGLKIELLKAIAQKALATTLEGKEMMFWDFAVLDEIESIARKINSPTEVTDVYCREKAREMLLELKKYMPSYAFKGLNAWVTFVDILDEATGTEPWFIKYEEIIIKRIGTMHFMTNDVLDRAYVKNNKNVYIPKEDGVSKNDKRLSGMYGIVHGETAHSRSVGENYSGRNNEPGWKTHSSCNLCGKSARRKVNGFVLCDSCYQEERRIHRFENIAIEEYVDKRTRKANAEKAKEIVVTLLK